MHEDVELINLAWNQLLNSLEDIDCLWLAIHCNIHTRKNRLMGFIGDAIISTIEHIKIVVVQNLSKKFNYISQIKKIIGV